MKLIPYGHQLVDNNDIKAVVKVLKSNWITQGPTIKDFENTLCKYSGAKYALAVSSGTAALHIACLAAGLQSGNEVITSPITFLATANSVLYCNAKPVFADVQEDTVNIDPVEIRKKITKKTKAIIPVDFAGNLCDLENIYSIAKEHDFIVIEDAAHALGAENKGLKTGSCKYSDMTIFSFHPVKSVTTGEGGAVLTNRKDLYNKLIMLRSHGITKEGFMNKADGEWYYEMQLLGYNYRMTDIQAALGISQLKKLDSFVLRRREIAGIYNKAFRDNPYFDITSENKIKGSAHHLYVIRLKKEYWKRKNEIFLKMRKSGLGVQVHYAPVYLQPYYKKLGFKRGLCPLAEDFYRSAISIPLYPALKDVEIKYVIKNIFKVFKEI